MKNKKMILAVLIFLLVLFYAFISYDLSMTSLDLQTLGKTGIIRVLSYSIIWGVLLIAISSQIDGQKRVIKVLLKIAGWWCVIIGIIVSLIVLSGITGA